MRNDDILNLQHVLACSLPSDVALEELAGQLGTTAALLRAFRDGYLRVPLDRAFKIADALGLDRAEFFAACLAQVLSEDDMVKFLEAFGRGDGPQHAAG